jgi:hypothetical protein
MSFGDWVRIKLVPAPDDGGTLATEAAVHGYTFIGGP